MPKHKEITPRYILDPKVIDQAHKQVMELLLSEGGYIFPGSERLLKIASQFLGIDQEGNKLPFGKQSIGFFIASLFPVNTSEELAAVRKDVKADPINSKDYSDVLAAAVVTGLNSLAIVNVLHHGDAFGNEDLGLRNAEKATSIPITNDTLPTFIDELKGLGTNSITLHGTVAASENPFNSIESNFVIDYDSVRIEDIDHKEMLMFDLRTLDQTKKAITIRFDIPAYFALGNNQESTQLIIQDASSRLVLSAVLKKNQIFLISNSVPPAG